MLWMSQFNQPLIYLTTLAQLVCFYFVLKRGLLEYHFPYSIRLVRLPKERMKLLSGLALCKPGLASVGGSCCLKKSHALIALDSCLESASRVLNSGNKRPLFPFCSHVSPFGHHGNLSIATQKPVQLVILLRPVQFWLNAILDHFLNLQFPRGTNFSNSDIFRGS